MQAGRLRYRFAYAYGVGLNEVLAFLPVFEAPGFVAATWPSAAELTRADGVMQMPYPTYSAEVDAFWEAVFRADVMRHPYEGLPEDNLPEGKAFDWTELRFDEDYFKTATRDQIGRYLFLTRRRERFSDGHIDEEFLRGAIVWALRRLQELNS